MPQLMARGKKPPISHAIYLLVHRAHPDPVFEQTSYSGTRDFFDEDDEDEDEGEKRQTLSFPKRRLIRFIVFSHDPQTGQVC